MNQEKECWKISGGCVYKNDDCLICPKESPKDRSFGTTKPDWEERFDYQYLVLGRTHDDWNRMMNDMKSFIRGVYEEGVREGIEMAVRVVEKINERVEDRTYGLQMEGGGNRSLESCMAEAVRIIESEALATLKEIQK